MSLQKIKWDVDLTGQNVFVISDNHFFHRRIIEFCSRPFQSVEEMDETMFNNWNNTVSDDDVVLFGGDFVVGSRSQGTDKDTAAKLLYDNLNGTKLFMRGNHDKEVTSIPFYSKQKMIIKYNDYTFTLSHYPLPNFDTDFLLYGHVHNNPHEISENKNVFNCSVENINYTPINLNEIINKLVVI